MNPALGLALLLGAPPLWGPLCSPCHGTGAGDGPAAKLYLNRPADLTRPQWRRAKSLDAARELVVHGIPGTPMPAFGAALSPADLEGLVVHAWSLKGAEVPPPAREWWPEGRVAAQGQPPLGAVPARRTLSAQACGRCHPDQHDRWKGSRHGQAMGPGVTGQFVGHGLRKRDGCDPCHAPLHEQRGPAELAGEGVTCAACHLRRHRKGGPPEPAVHRLPAHSQRAQPVSRFARSDFCLPCHDLPPSAAVAGSPLLSTWREWAASPYLPAGVQCQHCHMPDGDHGWAGAHDPAAVRRGVQLTVEMHNVRDRVRATARVHNVAVGHRFPTTATPRAVLRLRQVGPEGPVEEESWAIGRTVRHDPESGWQQVADTRIPPGEVAGRDYDRPRRAGATHLEVSLHMFPDWYYSTLYRRLLAGALPKAARGAFERALTDARASAFLVTFDRRPLDP